MEIHEKTCTNVSTIKSKMKAYGKNENLTNEIVDKGLLPESFRNYRQTICAAWDIETLESPCLVDDEMQTRTEAHLSLVSIGTATNLPGYDDEFFCKNSSDIGEGQRTVNNWLDYIFQLASAYQDFIPDEIIKAINKLDEKKKNKFSKNKCQNQSYLRHLRQYTEFNCFGYNSAKFDLGVIIPFISGYAGLHEIDIKVLKKGAKYISIGLKNKQGLTVMLKDVLNYTSPMSLDKYLQTWNGSSEKSIFPYQHFKKIEELEETDEFPLKESFFNTLKNESVDDEAYDEAKQEFNRRKALPDDHPEKIFNFRCWLRLYNLLDCAPLVRAIETSFGKFYEYFGVDPMIHLSLPSIAFK